MSPITALFPNQVSSLSRWLLEGSYSSGRALGKSRKVGNSPVKAHEMRSLGKKAVHIELKAFGRLCDQ